MTRLRRYHAPVWDEPVVMEMGREGRRGMRLPDAEPEVRALAGEIDSLLAAGSRRRRPPQLPQLSEFEVQRHYLHLSQETLGMMGISLFGTCTMKYNPRLNELVTARPWLAELHPDQDADTLQGVLQIIHGLDEILCELSGMARFVFQPGGGADAAYTHACVTRAYHHHRGELDRTRRGDHHHPGPPVQLRDRRGGGLQGDHASARGGRAIRLSPRSRLPCLRAHGRADGQQPR